MSSCKNICHCDHCCEDFCENCSRFYCITCGDSTVCEDCLRECPECGDQTCPHCFDDSKICCKGCAKQLEEEKEEKEDGEP